MKLKAFLSQDQIKERIAEEANSTKEQKMTPEQLEAIYSNGNNILVSASAGSGKTFVMVERILDMIARGIEMDQLFISTFTVKAATELKERLEKRLTKAILEAKTEEEIQHFSNQVSKIQTADIGTMDSFTQKLVNQYGYLIGISPVFRILTDESEQQLLKQAVYEDLFQDYRRKNEVTFQSLVEQFSGNRKDSKAFRDLVYKIYTFSQSTASPETWLKEIFLSSYQGDSAAQEKELLQTISQGQSLGELIDTAKRFFQNHLETVRGEFQKTYKYLTNVDELLLALDQLHGTDLENLNLLYEKTGEIIRLSSGRSLVMAVGSTKDEEIKAVASAYNKERNSYLEPFQQLHQAAFTLQSLLPHQDQILPLLTLLRDFVLDFSRQYLETKIQENAFEFNDIAHFAIRILEENKTVAELFQQKYHEVMVDEYQDNNHMQERMLELLSNGRNRFMVGDIKQSIYRFRQADPQIFNGKFKEYHKDPSQGQLILLKENFRSQSEVLDATNGVFSHLMDEAVGDIIYDQSHLLVAGSPKQKVAFPKHQTEVLIFNTQDQNREEDEDELPVSRGEIDLVAKEIIRLHNEEEVAFSGITLLVSSRTRNEALMAAFEEYGIPIESDGGEKNYLKSLEVMVMLDTLRVIDNPLNDYALVALLRSPMFGFDEDQMARIALQDKDSDFYDKMLLSSIQKGEQPQLIEPSLLEKIQHFLAILSDWRAYAKKRSLHDLIWKIYNDRFYYDYVAVLPRKDQRQANLYALALRADRFEKTGFKGLSRFIGMIDKVLETDTDLMEVEVGSPKDAVKLMTIHHSKGLEFEYVFVLNSDKKFSLKDTQSSAILSRDKGIGIKYWADMKRQVATDLPRLPVAIETVPFQLNQRELYLATLSEQMRLLYVAMTRAEKKLYLIGKGRRDKLEERFDGRVEEGRLPVSLREQLQSFQDWLLAIAEAFPSKDLAYTVRYVEADELTPDKIGSIAGKIDSKDLKDNRQTEEIKRALAILESVESLNKTYQAAIELPTVRTPSQMKAFYESIIDTEGVDIMDQDRLLRKETELTFELPSFGQKAKVSGAAIGSATHELMQRLSLTGDITPSLLRETLEMVVASEEVKERIDLDKIASFFETDLGQLILDNQDKFYREAPFAMLERDAVSDESFVVRGIVDGYLVFEDRIVLFDYKTDAYKDPSELTQRYQFQMELYSKALQRSYQIPQVDKYLVLLGGKELQVTRL